MSSFKSLLKQTAYWRSITEIEQLPADRGIEIAFIGRSNAGKSSALNYITGMPGLARISKTPGRTQAINLFQIDTQHCLVDLPGYGYARAPIAMQKHWEILCTSYLLYRHCLRGIMLVMDIRNPLKKLDLELLKLVQLSPKPIHILLTKADQVNTSVAKETVDKVQKALQAEQEISIQIFSAKKKIGVESAHDKLRAWLAIS